MFSCKKNWAYTKPLNNILPILHSYFSLFIQSQIRKRCHFCSAYLIDYSKLFNFLRRLLIKCFFFNQNKILHVMELYKNFHSNDLSVKDLDAIAEH